MTPSPTPQLQFIDENGDPYASGKLWTYVAGTTTPVVTYTDSTGGAEHTNPVILSDSGSASIWLAPGSAYKFRLLDANDSLIDTWDNIPGGSDLSGDNTWTGTQTFEGNIVFDGNGRRLKGDMTSTPAVNRLSVQTTVPASVTEFQILPSVGGGDAAVSVFTDPAVAGGVFGRFGVGASEVIISSGKLGGASYVPLVLNTGGSDWLTLSTAGVLILGNPCAFSVNRAGSGTFNVANNSVTAINWTAEDFDTGSYFDLSTDRFTPPAGYYQLSGVATGGWIDSGEYAISIYKNGSPFKNGSRPSVGSSSAGSAVVSCAISCTVHASGSDYFDMRVLQANPATSSVTYVDDAVQLYFCGHRVG